MARSVAAVGGKDEQYPYRSNYASFLIESHIIFHDMSWKKCLSLHAMKQDVFRRGIARLYPYGRHLAGPYAPNFPSSTSSLSSSSCLLFPCSCQINRVPWALVSPFLPFTDHPRIELHL
jgi:hypothetical protein